MNNYFSHDSNARNDEKILRLRMRHKSAGYGVYFMILERMRDENNYMCAKDYNLIAFDLREDAALVKSVVEDFGLFVFTDDGKYFYSESFLTRMKKKEDVNERRSKSGKNGAKSRWKGKGADTNGKEPAEGEGHTDSTTESEASAEASQKELPLFTDNAPHQDAPHDQDPMYIDDDSFIRYYNYAIKYYKSKLSPIGRMSDKRRVLLQSLLEHGYTKDDIVKVISEVAMSPRLNGRGEKSFIPEFTWIFTEDNFLKILEGNYRLK
jgi:hypothetical protein